MSVDDACRLTGVSRASYYRAWERNAPREAQTELRDRIQQICLEQRICGTRRVTAILHGEGMVVNRKRVQRLMRLDNLLALRKRRYVVTTDSRHTYAVYRNLTEGLEVTAANQLWVADITYIRLSEQFVYLAVILDAWSRRVVGWELGDSLRAELALAALRRALESRVVPQNLIHHSDRGVQYCAAEYVRLLKDAGISISMSRAGNPYDNAMAESFMRTLKCEEVYLTRYRNITHARERIGEFLEDHYNRKRPHSALGYRAPVAFEAAQV